MIELLTMIGIAIWAFAVGLGVGANLPEAAPVADYLFWGGLAFLVPGIILAVVHDQMRKR